MAKIRDYFMLIEAVKRYLSSRCTMRRFGWFGTRLSFFRIYSRLLCRYAPQGCIGRDGGLETAKICSVSPTYRTSPNTGGSCLQKVIKLDDQYVHKYQQLKVLGNVNIPMRSMQ
jgi:hypothetical protein